jgi:hypothetical protein
MGLSLKKNINGKFLICENKSWVEGSGSQCALGAFDRRLRSRLGTPKAITATPHRLVQKLDPV